MRRVTHPAAAAQSDQPIEPAEIGLTVCAGCGHRFTDGDRYHRGLAETKAGLALYITCHPCAEAIKRDPCGSLAVTMAGRLEDVILAGAPVGGAA